jgi:hypothetical protein
MPVRLLFKCHTCGEGPDELTRAGLERELLDPRFGEYVDVAPGNWLLWHGRGLYGAALFACGEHRGELKAFLREHYGTIGRHPWAMRSQPAGRQIDFARARRLARAASVPKAGL